MHFQFKLWLIKRPDQALSGKRTMEEIQQVCGGKGEHSTMKKRNGGGREEKPFLLNDKMKNTEYFPSQCI